MLLEMVADAVPDRVVVGPRDAGVTAAELLARARRAAARFRASPAAHVGFVDVNSDVLPVTLFGAALAGLPFAPISYRLTDDRLEALVARIAPAVVVAGDGVAGRFGPAGGIEVLTASRLRAAVSSAEGSGTDGPEGSAPAFADPEDVAVLLFTSGTTGEPKAAMLRHRHLTSYILGTVEFLGCGEDEAQLVSVPPYHIAGVSAILSSLFSGRRIVYQPEFDPEGWVRLVVDEGVTHAMVVPTMLGRVLDCIERTGAYPQTLRHLSYGGGRMPVEVIERAMDLLPHVDFVNAYGLTETSSTISVLTPDDHREARASADPKAQRRLTSVGRPLPTVEVEIRGPSGEALPAGERGEIHVRGEQVAGEYVGRRALTDDGWFPTNDAGWLDEDGFLYLDGRLDDVIVRGAENLSPGEIELVLQEHPAVEQAAVVGVPDAEWGEAVAAAVVLVPGAQVDIAELQDFVRARLRSTKTPQVIQIRDELPHNETGKLLRRVLREELAELHTGT